MSQTSRMLAGSKIIQVKLSWRYTSCVPMPTESVCRGMSLSMGNAIAISY